MVTTGVDAKGAEVTRWWGMRSASKGFLVGDAAHGVALIDGNSTLVRSSIRGPNLELLSRSAGVMRADVEKHRLEAAVEYATCEEATAAADEAAAQLAIAFVGLAACALLPPPIDACTIPAAALVAAAEVHLAFAVSARNTACQNGGGGGGWGGGGGGWGGGGGSCEDQWWDDPNFDVFACEEAAY